MDKKTIRISVRNLVEFIYASGDIDNRRGQSFDKEAMLKGGKLHRKIQTAMGKSYKAEVPLEWSQEFEDYILKVEGRADGIETLEDMVTIDEIKGMYRDVTLVEEPFFVHKAQAMCYGYMYGKEQFLSPLKIQLTYVNLETEIIKRFEEIFSFEELETWFFKLIEEYDKWARFKVLWEKNRDESMVGLEFPFPYRKGQRDIVTATYRTFLQNKEIFIQAPTGIGKTLSTLYPAIRAMGEGYGDKVFYLTAKTITRTVAKEAIHILQSRGLIFKAIILTAKEKMCACEEMDCNPQNCDHAKGHYDRVNKAVFASLQEFHMFTREVILQQAEKYKVCPFEFALDLSLWVDGIICDYNYVFDPNVKLKRFFQEGNKGEYLFLIDEAHNLVERGRQMYSATLSKNMVLEMKHTFEEQYPSTRKIIRGLEKLNRQLLEYKRNCDTYKVFEHIGTIALTCLQLQGNIDAWFEETKDKQKSDDMMEFYFQLRDFINVSELVDENYQIYGKCLESGDFILKEFCVNPARNIQECINCGRGAAFFSATLLPLDYYMNLFSTKKDNYAIYVDSPFSTEHRLLAVGCDVSSKYTRRGFQEYYKIGKYIQQVSEGCKGNYMIFFPSYKMMEEVVALYKNYIARDEEIIVQSSNMGEEQREEFLKCFLQHEKKLLAFCVLGGIFSEGIDLIGQQLIGVIIVGTGLPQVNDELEIVKNYYDKQGENGFDYAYRYPGMNKVLQGAGRVIRTSEDKGIICLLDDRFLSNTYQRLFPREWHPHYRCNQQTIKELVGEFWEKHIDNNSEEI